MATPPKAKTAARKPAAKKPALKPEAPEYAPSQATPDRVKEARYEMPTPTKAFVLYESRKPEPQAFSVAGVRSVRNFSNGHLEWRVQPEDEERFRKNHFVVIGRVRRAADQPGLPPQTAKG